MNLELKIKECLGMKEYENDTENISNVANRNFEMKVTLIPLPIG